MASSVSEAVIPISGHCTTRWAIVRCRAGLLPIHSAFNAHCQCLTMLWSKQPRSRCRCSNSPLPLLPPHTHSLTRVRHYSGKGTRAPSEQHSAMQLSADADTYCTYLRNLPAHERRAQRHIAHHSSRADNATSDDTQSACSAPLHPSSPHHPPSARPHTAHSLAAPPTPHVHS